MNEYALDTRTSIDSLKKLVQAPFILTWRFISPAYNYLRENSLRLLGLLFTYGFAGIVILLDFLAIPAILLGKLVDLFLDPVNNKFARFVDDFFMRLERQLGMVTTHVLGAFVHFIFALTVGVGLHQGFMAISAVLFRHAVNNFLSTMAVNAALLTFMQNVETLSARILDDPSRLFFSRNSRGNNTTAAAQLSIYQRVIDFALLPFMLLFGLRVLLGANINPDPTPIQPPNEALAEFDIPSVMLTKWIVKKAAAIREFFFGAAGNASTTVQIEPNLFDQSLERSIAQHDLHILLSFLNSEQDYYVPRTYALDNIFSARTLREIANSKFRSTRKWQHLTREQRATLTAEYPELCSEKSGELMSCPVYLIKSNGDRFYMDLFEAIDDATTNAQSTAISNLLSSLQEGGQLRNPATGGSLSSWTEFEFDPAAYAELETVAAESRGESTARRENLFDIALEQAIAVGDLNLVYQYLRDNGARSTDDCLLKLTPALKRQVEASKFNAMRSNNYWSEKFNSEVEKSEFEEANHDLVCQGLARALMCVPVYLQSSTHRDGQGNPIRTNLDFCSLLLYLQHNSINPATYEEIENLRHIRLNQDLYRSMPDYVANDQAWRAALANNNMQGFIDHLHAKCRSPTWNITTDRMRMTFDIRWNALDDLFAKCMKNQDDFWPSDTSAAAINLFKSLHRQFVCPISAQIMRHPVYVEINGSKYYYDLVPLTCWLRSNNCTLPGIAAADGMPSRLFTLNQIKYDPNMANEIKTAKEQFLVRNLAPAALVAHFTAQVARQQEQPQAANAVTAPMPPITPSTSPSASRG